MMVEHPVNIQKKSGHFKWVNGLVCELNPEKEYFTRSFKILAGLCFSQQSFIYSGLGPLPSCAPRLSKSLQECSNLSFCSVPQNKLVPQKIFIYHLL